jgi:DNA polymerase type B, organellar and viral
MTGASQSWSHWRHSHYTHKILVHDNEDALAAERAAMHTGRCEAWKWGKHNKEAWTEYDWQNSYPRIARDSLLPTKLLGTVSSPSAESLDTLIRKYAVLADCEVTTDTPCVPAQSEGRTLWPIGTFRTVLWDPEICLLREANATIRVHRAWLYKREPALREWAEWIISSLHEKEGTVEPWQKLILKHWSRALIGRFGMRYRAWDKYAVSEESRICISQTYNMDTGSQSELMQVGHDIFVLGKETEINDGAPQITGYIMSEARARLWRASQLIGTDHISYMDTDSLLVDSAGHRYIQSHQHYAIFDGLRSKAKYNRIHIYGPRSAIFDKRLSVSGLPKGSVQNGKDTWTGQVWRGAKESVRLNESNTVNITSTSFNLRYNACRRNYLASGNTAPWVYPPPSAQGARAFRPPRRKNVKGLDYSSVQSFAASEVKRN